MKIAVCGKMASGKTTFANMLINQKGEGTVLSLAKKVKDIGTELFFMEGKDRPLLQKIGMKMREIKEDVWLDYLIQSADDTSATVFTLILSLRTSMCPMADGMVHIIVRFRRKLCMTIDC